MVSKFFKTKAKKVNLEQPEPRQLDEITKQYTEVCAQVGQAQYQVLVYTKEVEKLNNILMSLNNEGQARKDLDKIKEQESKQEVANESK